MSYNRQGKLASAGPAVSSVASTPTGSERSHWSAGAALSYVFLTLLGLMGLLVGASRKRNRVGWAAIAFSSLALVLACGGSDGEPGGVLNESKELPAESVFFLNDLSGSPVAEVDARGELVRQVASHGYGAVRGSEGRAGDRLSFAGNERDTATGLHDFKARPYDAHLGAF